MRVLGISPAHDASVCVLNDGVVERFYKEERLSKKKRDKYPYLSLLEVHKEFGTDIDFIVVSSPTPNTFPDLEYFCSKLFNREVEFVCQHHHLQHASLAFYSSGFDRALTFVVDRNGSNFKEYFRESETVFFCDYPNNFTEVYKSFWRMNVGDEKLYNLLNQLKEQNPHCEFVCDSNFNITKVYESATTLISEHPLENGKTMGLSSYGRDKKFYDLFDESIPKDKYFTHLTKDHHPEMEVSVFKEYDLKTSNGVHKEDYQFYADYAYQVQKQSQEAVGDLIEKYSSNYATNNICITGGYGLNVLANSYYKKRFPNLNFFYEPLADDTGNSIGCALLKYHQETNTCKKFDMRGTFFHGVNYEIPERFPHCDEDYIAERILDQKSVAVYNGMAESGPRALGNRSILFDCRNKDSRDIVNKIKNREWYRPFAAICIEDDAKILFDYCSDENAKYMTMSFKVNPDYADIIPGVLHVDGTCRIQVINGDHHLFSLLNKIKSKTGYGILLNTSFNLAGDPLVETVSDALNVLKNSDLDIIWFPETNQYAECDDGSN